MLRRIQRREKCLEAYGEDKKAQKKNGEKEGLEEYGKEKLEEKNGEKRRLRRIWR